MRYVALVLLFIVVAAAVGRADELAFDLKVVQGVLPDEMRLIRVHQGDTVTLRWTIDRPVTVHLHGYDIEKRIAPGTTTEMKFAAYATGRFPIHIHAAGGQSGTVHEASPLAVIEVYPK